MTDLFDRQYYHYNYNYSDDDNDDVDPEVYSTRSPTLLDPATPRSDPNDKPPHSSSDEPTKAKPTRLWTLAGIALFGFLGLACIPASLFLLHSSKQQSTEQRTSLSGFQDGANTLDNIFDTAGNQATELVTIAPTMTPTTGAPSMSPSATPSTSPTLSPSLRPSGAPTESPTTAEPTDDPTSAPTRQLLPDDFWFRLKMHWEPQYCWQEVCQEERWCVECTRCSRLSGSGEALDFCRDPDNNNGNDCREGDLLWIQNCNGWRGSSGNVRMELIQSQEGWDLIKIYRKDLCVEKQGKFLNLKPCDTSNVNQRFLGFDPDAPFVWKPYVQDFAEERCLSQHHWPKKYELLFLEDCSLARTWDTSLWEIL